MNRVSRTLFVIDEAIFRLKDVSLVPPVVLRVKDTQPKKKVATDGSAAEQAPPAPAYVDQIRIEKALPTSVIENILECSRVVWDVQDADLRQTVGIAVQRSTTLQPLLTWSTEQQSFSQLCDALANFGADASLQRTKEDDMTDGDEYSRSITQICDFLLDSASPEDAPAEVNVVMLSTYQQRSRLIDSIQKRWSQWLNDSNRSEEQRSLLAHISRWNWDLVLLPHSNATEVSSQLPTDLPVREELYDAEDSVGDRFDANCNLWTVKRSAASTPDADDTTAVDPLSALFRRLLQRHIHLVTVNIRGIPMLQSSSKQNISQDVELLCSGHTFDLVWRMEDAFATTEAGKPSSVNLRWKKVDKRFNIEQHHLTRSVHRVTYVRSNTQPTMCLMKHLASNRPVGLVLETPGKQVDANSEQATHLLLQHGNNVYLHVLDQADTSRPLLTRSVELKQPYRVDHFKKLIQKHMVYIVDKPATSASTPISDAGSSTLASSVSTPAAESATTPMGMTADGTALPQQPSAVEAQAPAPAPAPQAQVEPASLLQQQPQHWSLMRLNQFIYRTPTIAERATRVFPLVSDTSSVLYSEVWNDALESELRPLLNLLAKRTLPEHEEQRAKGILANLRRSAQHNEVRLFPDHEQDHSARSKLYNVLWRDVRNLVRNLDHKVLLVAMDKIWPNFVSLDAQAQSAAPSSGSKKRLIDVPRDAQGNPALPIQVGGITIHNLGTVLDKPAYHTDKYIWTVGFKSSKMYQSTRNAGQKCRYYSEIRNGGDAPLFVVTSEDDPDLVASGPNATAAWTQVVKRVNELKDAQQQKKLQTNVSGPEYYGLATPTVQMLISELPNAEKVHRPRSDFQPEAAKTLEQGAAISTFEDTRAVELSDDDMSDTEGDTESQMPSAATKAQQEQAIQAHHAATDKIPAARKQRDEFYHDLRERAEQEATRSTHWTTQLSFLDFVREKQARIDDLVVRDIDGRKDSENPYQVTLYADFLANLEKQGAQGMPTESGASSGAGNSYGDHGTEGGYSNQSHRGGKGFYRGRGGAGGGRGGGGRGRKRRRDSGAYQRDQQSAGGQHDYYHQSKF